MLLCCAPGGPYGVSLHENRVEPRLDAARVLPCSTSTHFDARRVCSGPLCAPQTQRQLQLSLEAHGRYIASLMEQEGLTSRLPELSGGAPAAAPVAAGGAAGGMIAPPPPQQQLQHQPQLLQPQGSLPAGGSSEAHAAAGAGTMVVHQQQQQHVHHHHQQQQVQMQQHARHCDTCGAGGAGGAPSGGSSMQQLQAAEQQRTELVVAGRLGSMPAPASSSPLAGQAHQQQPLAGGAAHLVHVHSHTPGGQPHVQHQDAFAGAATAAAHASPGLPQSHSHLLPADLSSNAGPDTSAGQIKPEPDMSQQQQQQEQQEAEQLAQGLLNDSSAGAGAVSGSDGGGLGDFDFGDFGDLDGGAQGGLLGPGDLIGIAELEAAAAHEQQQEQEHDPLDADRAKRQRVEP